MFLEQKNSRSFGIPVGLLVSIILHIICLIYLVTAKIPIENSQEIIPVSYIELPKKEKIIVSTTDSENSKPNPEANKLSDKDSAVEKETIKKGAGFENKTDAIKQNKSQEKERVKQVEKNIEPKPIKNLEPQKIDKPISAPNLKLNIGDLAASFADGAKNNQNKSVQNKAAPFSRPQGSGAVFFGPGGVPDVVPGLPDGDITMLNAKADKFASFVRRVAIQVFGRLRESGWSGLTAEQVQSISEYVSLEALLDKNGELEKVTLKNESGSDKFDIIVKDSVNKGARDKNPPIQAAREDGKYLFVFRARSWAEFGPTRGVGGVGISEKRWIELGVGLL